MAFGNAKARKTSALILALRNAAAVMVFVTDLRRLMVYVMQDPMHFQMMKQNLLTLMVIEQGTMQIQMMTMTAFLISMKLQMERIQRILILMVMAFVMDL